VHGRGGHRQHLRRYLVPGDHRSRDAGVRDLPAAGNLQARNPSRVMTKLGRLTLSLPMPEAVMVRAAEHFHLDAPDRPIPMDQVAENAIHHRADALLISLGLPVKAEHIAKLPPETKIIATASVGFEHIDIRAANARGIVVTNTPDVLTDATADTHMLL